MDKHGKLYQLKKQLPLQMFVWAGIAYLLIFHVIPMFGIIIGFKDYNITSGIKGIFTSEWVGLKYFKEFITDYKFPNLLRNTVGISVLKLIFSFPVPIMFAVMLHEMRGKKFKRVVQTCSYLPHFISWVIIAGLSFQMFSSTGVVNTALGLLPGFKEPIRFLTQENLYWGVAVFLDVWKETGWGAIVFLAAISGIGRDLYEAAEIDGAGRMQRIWNITLPCIKGTIVIVLIMTMGNLFGGGLGGSNFEQSYLLGNDVNKSASEIIQTYTFEVGLKNGRYSYATAVGLIQSMVSLILIFISNFVSKKISGAGLF